MTEAVTAGIHGKGSGRAPAAEGGQRHSEGEQSDHPSLPAVPLFDDTNTYYDLANPWGSVMNPNTGTQIRVVNTSALGNFMRVVVQPSP